MPDNLTQRIQSELSDRGIAASLNKIEDILEGMPALPNQNVNQGRAPTIWESLETGKAPDWLVSGTEEYKSNLFKALGKGAWAAAETGTFGLAGLGLRALSKETYEAWQPVSFGERVAAGLGTVAGFLPPFTLARGVAAAGLKGVQVVKGGKVVGMGTKVASAKYTDNVVRILKNDKTFLKWASDKGMSPTQIEKFIRESNFVKEGAGAIGAVGKKNGFSIFGNASLRTQYAKNIDKNIDTILAGKIAEYSKMHKGFTMSEKARGIMGDELRKYVGGKYNFPIADLHSYWALKLGSTKAASLAAAAAEEAILFTAVELPMNFFQSINNEYVDLAPFSTMLHATALGSALGLVRLIPGGANAPLLGSAIRRIKQNFTKRTRWDKYNVNKQADRDLLVQHSRYLWDSNKNIFATLSKLKTTEFGELRQLVRDTKAIEEFASSATKARELKKWMVNLENNFLKNWWPAFGRQASEDLSGSALRMLAGSLAFNVTTVWDYMNGELPVEDLVFHTVLGAVLSKKGKSIEYKDADGNIKRIPGSETPHYFDDSFEKVNKYLDLLGMDLDHAAFRNMVNNLKIMKDFGQPDLNHEDMIKIVNILKDSKLVVGVDKKPKIKNDNVTSNSFYDTLKSIMTASIKEKDRPNYRVKEFNEISIDDMQVIMDKLGKTSFKSLTEYRSSPKGAEGIHTVFDLWDVLTGSAATTTRKSQGIYTEAVREAYNTMYEMEHIANKSSGDAPIVQVQDGKLVLRPIEINPLSLTADYDIRRMGDMFGTGDAKDDNSALGVLKDRVIIRGNPINLSPEMSEKLFGLQGRDRGIVDRFDRELTNEFIGEGTPVDDNNLLTIGMKSHMDMMSLHMLREGIMKTYGEMVKLRQGDESGLFGDDVLAVQQLYNSIISTPKGLVPLKVIVESEPGKPVKANTAEQKFVNDLLSIREADITLPHTRRGFGQDEKPHTVNVSKVTELIEIFKTKGLYQAFDRLGGDRNDMVSPFVKRLKSYMFEKTLGSARRNDGSPLTEKDYAILRVLQEYSLSGPMFDMAELGDYIGNIKSMLLKSDILSADDKGDVNTNMVNWVKKNLNKVEDAFGELDVDKDTGSKNLYDIFTELRDKVIEQGGKDGEITVAHMMGEYVTLVEDILKPLWLRGKGGILKPSTIHALPTADGIYSLLTQMEAIRSGTLTVSYEQLVDSTYRLSRAADINPDLKKFLSTVLNTIVDRRGNINRGLEILKKYNLYDADTGQYLIKEREKISDTLKKAAYDMQMLTQPITTERHIALLQERDKIEFSPRHDSDFNTNMTFDTLLSDWGIDIPEIGNLKKMEIVMQSVAGENKGKFGLKAFYNHLVNRVIVKEIDGVMYSAKNWDDLPTDEMTKFKSDVNKVWNSITQSVEAKTIKIGEGGWPVSERISSRSNDLSNFLMDEFGEVVFVDFGFRRRDGKTFNVQTSARSLREDFIKELAKVVMKKEGRIIMSDRDVDPSDDLVHESGYLYASFGDLDYGIAIPRVGFKPGVPPTGPHKMADTFVKRLYSARERFKDNPDLLSTINRLINRYVETESTRIVEDTQSGEVDIKPEDRVYKMRRETKDIASSDELTLMLTVAFGDTKMGEVFWKAASNSKAEKWNSSKELAHDILRRLRLYSNRSTLKLSKKATKEIMDFWGDKKLFKPLEIDEPAVFGLLKSISKTGKIKAHLMNDEADILPTISSAVENLRRQVIQENKDAAGYDIIGLETRNGIRMFPEGAKDTSHFNSVVLVSEKLMTALKLLTGDYHKTGSVANKPIIANASDTDMAFIGKTMFVVDKNFDSYFDTNKVDMVVFGSAIKGMGSGWEKSLIDLKGVGDNIDSLLDFKDTENRSVGIPIESIGIQMWHSNDKSATIPMHVGADLVGESLNGEYFDWLMRKPVVNYQEQVQGMVNSGNIDNMIAAGKNLFGDTGTDVDNNMFSTISKMMEHNMYSMFLPWKRTMKNAIMRRFIRDTGMLSPINEFGSQSAAIPAYFPFGHEKGLRNTTFYEDAETGEIGIFSIGQMEIGIGNASKGIGDNVSITLHHKRRPDELLKWNDFVDRIKSRGQEKVQELTTVLRKGEKALSKEGLKTLERIQDIVVNANLKDFSFRDGRDPSVVLQDLHNYLAKELPGTKLLGEGESAEVAIVIHRTPSLKSSDKVIVGLKGFVEEGNLARINTTDFWTRLEGDHDFDKVNYWWDTPTGVLNEWKSNSHKIRAVVDDSDPTSIKGLSLDDPSSISKYSSDSAKATFMRGPVVKARRIVQWIKHYQGKEISDEFKGYNAVFGRTGSKYLVSVDESQLDAIDKRMAVDAQRIIDSKDGWTVEDFDREYLSNLLFGKGDWDGIFKVSRLDETKNSWFDTGDKLRDEWKLAVLESIKPYGNLLQLSTDVYEGGEGKKVDYEMMVSGYETYNDIMGGINRHVLKKLRKMDKGPRPEVLDEMFNVSKDKTRPDDVFGLSGAVFPSAPSKFETNTIGRTRGMLPFDRALWGVAAVDRMFTERPHRNIRYEDDDFDVIWEKHIDKDGETSDVIKTLTDRIRKDAKSMAYLNTLDRKISRIDRSLYSAKKFKNQDMIDDLDSRLASLREIKKGVEDNILLDEEAGAAIRNTIKSQMIETILKGRPIYLSDYNPKTGKWLSQMKLVQLKGKSFNQRQKWVDENMIRINYSIWRNPKFAVNIKGYSTNDYAQLAMWHKTMTDLTGFAFDPRLYEFAEIFEQDIFETRGKIASNWGAWKSKSGEYMPNELEDVVNADNMRLLQSKFDAWEKTKPGAGLVFIFKLMTPIPDGLTVSYQNGHFLPGFKNIKKEQKYINLGLNFINKTDGIPEAPWLRLIAKKGGMPYKQYASGHDRKHEIFRVLAENFTDKMRVLYDDVKVDESTVPKSVEELLSGQESMPIDFKLLADDTGLETQRNFGVDIDKLFSTINENDLNKLDALNPQIKQYYGITGTDLSMDFLSMRGAPPGVDKLYEIRKLAEFYFRPYKVLNSRGKLRGVRDLKSFYGFIRREALMFYGSTAEENMYTGEKTPHVDINAYGGVYEGTSETGGNVLQQYTDMIKGFYCG